MNYLSDLLLSVPKAAALIDEKQRILECNDKFIAAAPDGKNKSAPGFLAEGVHKTRLATLLSADKTGWRGAEITLELNGKATLCWCETHSIMVPQQIKNGQFGRKLMHFFEFQNIEEFRALEAAYLHQLRRVVDDNLWILDEEGILLWVRADNPEYKKSKGRNSDALIMPENRQLWKNILSEAKQSPGKFFEVQVRAAIDGEARYIDLCYLSTILGGRFYVASRSTVPTGSRIVLRLKEAWAVVTDDELAKKINTKQPAISRANAADHVPSDWLVKTGQMTGFSIDWLLTGQGEKRKL